MSDLLTLAVRTTADGHQEVVCWFTQASAGMIPRRAAHVPVDPTKGTGRYLAALLREWVESTLEPF